MTMLDVQTQTDGDTTRVSVSGELDISNALSFEHELRRAEHEDHQVLVLDLRSLKFMDSTGLRLILSADQRARRCGRRLEIIEGSTAVKRLFRLAGVDARLELSSGPAA